MIVVDTNIIGYLFLSSERSGQVEQVMAKDRHWAAPLLWHSELRNVLATYLKQHRIGIGDALKIITEAEELMSGSEYKIVSSQVLKLSKESGCSAYDCEFVALAMDLHVPLITVDRQILNRFPQTAISPDDFLAGPIKNC